jgi:hypothetical protein
VPTTDPAWGQWPDRDRDMAAIARYARATQLNASTPVMDDRTWTDLNMDDVFVVLDRTSSLLGAQVLYARLRSLESARDLDSFETLTTRFESDAAVRTRAQVVLTRLGDVDGHDLWMLAQPGTVQREAWHLVFPLLALVMVALLVVAPFHPAAIFFLLIGAFASLGLRAAAAPRLRLVVDAFRQVGPMLSAATKIEALRLDGTAGLKALGGDLRALGRLKAIASWVGRAPGRAASGDLGAAFIEFLNMVLCLDGIALFAGARELQARSAELTRVVATVGEVDAAISVASYRHGTPGWTHPTFRPQGSATRFEAVRHPLVPDAVANTITLGPPNGVVITGSNMSGKSTFLRTIGVTTVMAQTINTCVASVYEAPARLVRSCIGRVDDPAQGKSYYLVEVEAVLDLVRAAAEGQPLLLLFDELFHGTNTVERLAAGESVVRELLSRRAAGAGAEPAHIVVTATHDQEMVEMLSDVCASFHFADDVSETGLAFDYQLRSGPATSRNAIELLRIKGAPADLIARAQARADAIDSSRLRLDIRVR